MLRSKLSKPAGSLTVDYARVLILVDSEFPIAGKDVVGSSRFQVFHAVEFEQLDWAKAVVRGFLP